MKKYWWVFVLLVIIALIVVIIVFKDESNIYFHEINYDQLMEKIDKEENFILVAESSQCNHCATYMPKFQRVVNEYKITAYYINLYNLTNDEKTTFNEHVSINGETPTTVFFEKGIELGSQTRIIGDKDRMTILDKLNIRGYIKTEE